MDKPKNRFDELLEIFELSKAEMTNEQLQGFAKAVLKYASSNEEANKYIDQLLADISEKEEDSKLFKRTAMYHRHSRDLDDLREKDFVKKGDDIFQVINHPASYVKEITDGYCELYLTFEEAEEAHKRAESEKNKEV